MIDLIKHKNARKLGNKMNQTKLPNENNLTHPRYKYKICSTLKDRAHFQNHNAITGITVTQMEQIQSHRCNNWWQV